MKRYADKIGVDFCYEHSEKKPRYPLFEKFKIKKFLQNYDQVLFLDCDILIRPDSPDIFSLVPKGHFAALNEGSLCNEEELLARWILVEKVSKVIGVPVVNFDMTRQYYNGGVFMIDKSHENIFEIPQADSFMLEVTSEQNTMNVRIHDEKHKTFDLPIEYNYMPWRWSKNHLQDGYFIHYAGMKSTLRYDSIKRDYEYLIKAYG